MLEGLTGKIGVSAFAAAMFVAAHGARGVTIFTDGFGDGDRNNDGSTELFGGAVVTNPADVGIKWFGIEGVSTQKPLFTVRDDAAGIGAGNALHAESAGSGAEWIGVLPTQAAVGINVGDKLVLTLKFRINGASPHGVPTGAGSFRIGLYEDADNEFGTGSAPIWGQADGNFDGATAPGAADDPGWFARIPVGTASLASDFRLIEEQGNNGDILSGSGVDSDNVAGGNSSSTADDLQIIDALAHTITITLERATAGLAGNILGSLTVDSTTISGTEVGINTSTFEYLALVDAGVDYDYLIDSVQLDVLPIPEPASLAFLALGGIGLLRRRET